jgi:hypothetical protein
MFNKLFGKKDGFYMQVDESAPAKVNTPKVEKAAPKTEEAPKALSDAIAVVEESTTTAPADAKAKSAKTSIKKDKNKDPKKDAAKAKPEVIATVPAIVTPAAPAITNFATDYLVIPAVAGNRRRPGANMKGFMTMAREVKETKKGSQGNQQRIEEAKKV